MWGGSRCPGDCERLCGGAPFDRGVRAPRRSWVARDACSGNTPVRARCLPASSIPARAPGFVGAAVRMCVRLRACSCVCATAGARGSSPGPMPRAGDQRTGSGLAGAGCRLGLVRCAFLAAPGLASAVFLGRAAAARLARLPSLRPGGAADRDWARLAAVSYAAGDVARHTRGPWRGASSRRTPGRSHALTAFCAAGLSPEHQDSPKDYVAPRVPPIPASRNTTSCTHATQAG